MIRPCPLACVNVSWDKPISGCSSASFERLLLPLLSIRVMNDDGRDPRSAHHSKNRVRGLMPTRLIRLPHMAWTHSWLD